MEDLKLAGTILGKLALIVLVSLGIAMVAVLASGNGVKTTTDPNAWFADCVQRGNDPLWCKESEDR